MRPYAVLALIVLVSCAKSLPPPVDLPVSVPVVETPVPAPKPDLPIMDEWPLAYPVIPTIETAMRQARRTPAPAQFSRGLLRYTFEQPSPIWRLDVAVDTFSTIVLAPGEQLYYKGLADTKRWVWDETIVGAGEERRSVILLKPESDKLRTTILLTTSLGMYHLEAYAHKTSYVAAVAWKHPDRVALTKPPPLPSRTRYQMRVITSPAPAWTPTSAWDDGQKSFVRCADALQVTDTPVLYVLPADAEAEPQLVNYRLKGTLYVVDRLLGPGEAFELRLGDGEALQAVRIERQEATHVP